MTFKQIVWKMAKYNYRKYTFYLVCNFLAVMFFFMFTTIYFNEHIAGLEDSLSIPAAALVLFTVFFISYAHHIFMKKRRSEFGLFMILGMTKRDISKLVLLENGIIAGLALIVGILVGTIFSRFFFWLLSIGLGLQGFAYQLNAKMFIYSIVLFLLVFIVAVAQSLYVTMNKHLIQNLQNERVTESVSNKYPIIGGIGLFIIVGSIVGLYLTYVEHQGEYLLLWALATFLGLYIALYQFTSLIIEILKMYKSFYYHRILSLTNIDYKYRQLTSIMMVVTMMIMVTLLYSTVTWFTYTNGIIVFITIFLSLLFFIGSFFLLYIQLFSEVDREKQRIQKLQRIGITSKEVKKMISQEITTLFMVPTVLGMILALFYIIAMATDIGGVMDNPLILYQFFIIAGIYFIIQYGFLLYAKKKMYLQMIN